MPSLLTPLPDVAFPHELDRLTVAATAPTRKIPPMSRPPPTIFPTPRKR